MNKSVLFIVTFFLLPCISTSDEPLRIENLIAVLDIETGKGVDKSLGPILTSTVLDEMVKAGRYKVIDRANRDKILSEQGFQQKGCVASNCQVEMGRLLGVGKLVVGRVDRIAENYIIFLQIINVKTGNIEASAREICADDAQLIHTTSNATRQLLGFKFAGQPSQQSSAQRKTLGKCPEDMAYIPEGKFCIDIYEYPNKKGIQPKGDVYIDKARTNCGSLGKRLPKPEEFEMACMGPERLKYFTSNEFDPSRCNTGRDLKPSGSFPECTNSYGLYDMVGNIYEWTDDGISRTQYIMGGSVRESKKYLDCNTKFAATSSIRWSTYSWRVGFRCAKDAE